jgi:hypothetical protein
MKEIRYWPILFALFLAFFSGCSPFFYQRIPESFKRPTECQAFFDQLDARVIEAGVKDASGYSVHGFPYLRTNRFLSTLKGKLKEEKEKEQWLRWMQELDLKAREKEISTLPHNILLSLEDVGGEGQTVREKLIASVKACSDTLLENDRSQPDFYGTLDSLLDVPDEYSFFMRAAGLYPIMVIPVAFVTQLSRDKTRSWYETNLNDLPLDGRLKAFIPEERLSFTQKEIEVMINESKKNALRIPVPDRDLEKKLIWSFAPVFIQDVAAPYDQLGQVVWEGEALEIDPSKPTVYYYFSHAFLKGESILQINYVIWFSARAGKRSPRIERGPIDGLTFRVSLDGQGKPFMVDVVNDCGCYHLFAPEKERVEGLISTPFRFGPFVPQWLPKVSSEERLGVRLNSGWHQVQRLLPVKEVPDPVPYDLVPYDALEALPHEDGWTESIFDASGIVKGTGRVERFILFSMGIPSIGSMRQRGHHAIELIGRAHFDDPDLFDQSFIFK